MGEKKGSNTPKSDVFHSPCARGLGTTMACHLSLWWFYKHYGVLSLCIAPRSWDVTDCLSISPLMNIDHLATNMMVLSSPPVTTPVIDISPVQPSSAYPCTPHTTKQYSSTCVILHPCTLVSATQFMYCLITSSFILLFTDSLYCLLLLPLTTFTCLLHC